MDSGVGSGEGSGVGVGAGDGKGSGVGSGGGKGVGAGVGSRIGSVVGSGSAVGAAVISGRGAPAQPASRDRERIRAVIIVELLFIKKGLFYTFLRLNLTTLAA